MLILYLMILVQPLVFAKESLSVKWLGVASVALSDGKDTLVFDPVPTKPTLMNWVLGTELRSDPVRVTRMIERAEIEQVSGVFLSHTHFDHAVDGAEVAVRMKAPIYGGASVAKIAHAHDPSPRFIGIIPDQKLTIGKFKITPIRRQHATILSLFQFLPGEVRAGFSFQFYQYREGETWNYYIEHPLGNILFDQSGQFHAPNAKFKGQVDTHLSGVSNRKSDQDWVENNILAINPKRVIPLHFDVFFLQGEWLEQQHLPGARLEQLEALLKTKAPTVKWTTPQLYQKIALD